MGGWIKLPLRRGVPVAKAPTLLDELERARGRSNSNFLTDDMLFPRVVSA
jgi:hypothetical protein